MPGGLSLTAPRNAAQNQVEGQREKPVVERLEQRSVRPAQHVRLRSKEEEAPLDQQRADRGRKEGDQEVIPKDRLVEDSDGPARQGARHQEAPHIPLGVGSLQQTHQEPEERARRRIGEQADDKERREAQVRPRLMDRQRAAVSSLEDKRDQEDQNQAYAQSGAVHSGIEGRT